MPDKLYRLDHFSTLDYDGIAAHLARMTERGWMIEKIGPLWWTYRRAEPERLTFQVCRAPVSSPFDPAGRELEFSDYLGHAGWEPAAETPWYQVYVTRREDAVPVCTDPALELMAVNAFAMKSIVPFGALALPLCLWGAVTLIRDLMAAPALTRPAVTAAFAAAIFALTAIYYAVELTSYLIYYINAKKSVATGDRPRRFGGGGVLRILQYAALGLLICWIAACAALSQGAGWILAAAAIIAAAALFSIPNAVRKTLRRRSTARELNRAATTAASLALFTAFTLACTWLR